MLESSDSLRATGVAFTTFTNAWRALDALGIGHFLRQHHGQLFGIYSSSTVSGDLTSYVPFTSKGTHGDHEVRCVKRKALLEALAKELPSGTIRYSSKVISIHDSGFEKLVHLADASILKTQMLIGCDGVNSVVAKYLGFKKPSLSGRSAIRGCAYYTGGHGFEPKFQQFMGNGVRYGIVPCDDASVYWFFTWSPSPQERELLKDADQLKVKQFVLSKLGKVSDQIRGVIEDTGLEEIIQSPLGFRSPWEMLCGNISKDNVCVAGDACHSMTPDLGQGGCSALEDGVILARCLAEALLDRSTCQTGVNGNYKFEEIKTGLNNYAKKRRWRAFDLITTGCMLAFIQESHWIGFRFLRERLLSAFLSGMFLKKADIDPTQLQLVIQC